MFHVEDRPSPRSADGKGTRRGSDGFAKGKGKGKGKSKGQGKHEGRRFEYPLRPARAVSTTDVIDLTRSSSEDNSPSLGFSRDDDDGRVPAAAFPPIVAAKVSSPEPKLKTPENASDDGEYLMGQDYIDWLLTDITPFPSEPIVIDGEGAVENRQMFAVEVAGGTQDAIGASAVAAPDQVAEASVDTNEATAVAVSRAGPTIRVSDLLNRPPPVRRSSFDRVLGRVLRRF